MNAMGTSSPNRLPEEILNLIDSMRDFGGQKSHPLNKLCIDDCAVTIKAVIANLGWEFSDVPGSTSRRERIIGNDFFNSAVRTAYANNAQAFLEYLQDPAHSKNETAISALGEAMLQLVAAAGEEGRFVQRKIAAAALDIASGARPIIYLDNAEPENVVLGKPDHLWGQVSQTVTDAYKAVGAWLRHPRRDKRNTL